jgi:hypothetical protein
MVQGVLRHTATVSGWETAMRDGQVKQFRTEIVWDCFPS